MAVRPTPMTAAAAGWSRSVLLQLYQMRVLIPILLLVLHCRRVTEACVCVVLLEELLLLLQGRVAIGPVVGVVSVMRTAIAMRIRAADPRRRARFATRV